jgi:biopolymer transport protein ExbB
MPSDFGSLVTIYHHGGFTLAVIFVMSVLALAVGLERFYVAFFAKKHLRKSLDRILDCVREGNQPLAQSVNAMMPRHPATHVLAILLGDKDVSEKDVRREQSKAIRKVGRRLWILGSIGSIAPFVGLFGTVLGIMEAFRQIGVEGSGGFQVVSSGISEALVTTAAGIFVAVEAVVLFNYLQVNLSEYAAELKESVEELIEEVGDGVSKA